MGQATTPELIDEAVGDSKDTAIPPDIFAQYDHTVVLFHLLAQSRI
jgi:hypothetical protein